MKKENYGSGNENVHSTKTSNYRSMSSMRKPTMSTLSAVHSQSQSNNNIMHRNIEIRHGRNASTLLPEIERNKGGSNVNLMNQKFKTINIKHKKS